MAVHWIGTMLQSCYYPQSRLCGLEMLFKMAQESSIDIRLQYILPYIQELFEDTCSKVRAKALYVAVHIFADIIDKAYLTTLNATDYKIFENYILPAFLRLKNDTAKDIHM